MTRRPPISDPTAKQATTNTLVLSPDTWLRLEELIRVVASMDLSAAEALRINGVSLRKLISNFNKGAASRPHSLLEIRDLAEGLPPEVKAHVGELERSFLRPCERCQRPEVPPTTRSGGRPQRFCSNACRQAAYRQRAQAQPTY